MNLYTFIVGSAAFLIHLYSEKYRKDDLALTLDELDNDDNLPRIRTYDFIVVGGGAAGCVIANRLSEHYNVLLLEAGGTPVPTTRPLIFYPNVMIHPSINYKYTSLPHTDMALETGGVVKHSEGKMLGGSMSHNGLGHNRGSPQTFDEWAILLNDSSWEYKNVLKYFKRSENYKSDVSTSERGHGGLLVVERFTPPILRTWFKAGTELGYRTTLDPNTGHVESFSADDVTQENGKRVSSYTAFIEPIENLRKTLRIERYSFVSEILIKEKRAYGVAYTRHGIPQIAHASKEVIVSCGAYGSPILLMKSGIGPKEILQEAGIRTAVDLPVGETLNEHLAVGLNFSINDNGTLAPSYNSELGEDSLKEYHRNGRGILGYTIFPVQAFLVSTRARTQGQLNWPDLQVQMGDLLYPPPTQTTRLLNFEIALTRRQTRGFIGLNITAYKSGLRKNEELAVIDYTSIKEPSDTDVLLEGIKLVLTTMEDTTAFRELGAKFLGEKHPGCSKFKFRTDEYWRCHILQVGIPHVHASGTCRMGFGLEDKVAVLGSDLNVLGMSGLRVVDASAMPTTPTANPTAPVIMLAEKASDVILKCWQ